uniref:Uncharacterized protein n=1 Tax=Pristionchus pacificus TaxID=54126 RepID=A0A8R1UQN1_PRIPA
MREETEAEIVPLQMPYRELQSRVPLGKKSGAASGCRPSSEKTCENEHPRHFPKSICVIPRDCHSSRLLPPPPPPPPPKVCHVIDEAIGSLFDDTNAMESPLPMGWALPERKKFPDSVKSFLKKLYDEGERTGAKIDAREAEQLMRYATTSNGDMLFKVEHLLNCHCRRLRRFQEELNKIGRAKASGSRGKRDAHPEPEPDEVNDLVANDQYEGDPELEYETEPLFDVTDLMRIALTREHNNLWSKEGEK